MNSPIIDRHNRWYQIPSTSYARPVTQERESDHHLISALLRKRAMMRVPGIASYEQKLQAARTHPYYSILPAPGSGAIPFGVQQWTPSPITDLLTVTGPYLARSGPPHPRQRGSQEEADRFAAQYLLTKRLLQRDADAVDQIPPIPRGRERYARKGSQIVPERH